MKGDEPKTYRWTRDKYDKMAEVGILKPNARVELQPKPLCSQQWQWQTDCFNNVVNAWSSSTINH